MNVGFRVNRNVKRADPALIEQFRGIPTSNINDMMNRLYNMNGSIRAINDRPLLGSAITVKAPLGDNLMFHYAMDLAKPGDVIVVDGGGCCDRSLAGEIMLTYSAIKGIAGWVVDGALRDLDALRNGPIPIYCKAITPQGPYKNGPGEINVPVCCGGVAVLPGDIIVGDCDGIVVIRPEDAPYIAQRATQKHADELKQLDRYYKVGLGSSHEESYSRQLTEKGCFFF